MIGSRTGRRAQAYQVQKAIPDRHTIGIITEQMFFSQVESVTLDSYKATIQEKGVLPLRHSKR